MCCEIGVHFHSFVCEYAVFSTPFIEKSVLSPLNGLLTLVENQWPMDVLWILLSFLNLVICVFNFIDSK